MDLTDDTRFWLEAHITQIVQSLHARGQSLGIAREAAFNAFDIAAEEAGK